MVKRTFLFVVLCAAIWAGSTYYSSAIQPDVSTQLSVAAVNGGNSDAANLRLAQAANNQIALVTLGFSALAFFVCYGTYIKQGFKKLVNKEKTNNA